MAQDARLLKITESDGEIAKALESANGPALLMALLQMTGDPKILSGAIRPVATTLGDDQGGLTPEQRAEIARRALDSLRAYRDGKLTLPALPSERELIERMSFMVGAPVPDEYVPLLVEEMALDGKDRRQLQIADTVPRERVREFKVVIVGAGMSGILAAIRLEQAGIPYVILEKNSTVGGTWFENSYPGCRVDVPNHFYSYSFEPNHDWPEHFSTRKHLWDYFERCADKYGVRAHVRFDTEVISARFDDSTARWSVVAKHKSGKEETFDAAALISAVGQLSRPKLPKIPGLENFRGVKFHSAQWEHQHDLTGKRVIIVGTGATAFQVVPEIAEKVRDLVIFQRSAPWMFPTDDYHAPVDDGSKWLLKKVPFYASWYRFWLFWTLSDGFLPTLTIDRSWPNQARSVNALNEEMRVMLTDYVKEQVGDDPELLAKCIPDYPPGGKRMLRDNGSWLRALKRPNVHVVTDPIREITETGVRTASGAEYAADVLLLCTGFKADHFLWPMKLTGAKGLALDQHWGDDPRAYLGITVPGFPNLFCLYGPNTNLVHGGSIIFHSECEVRYVMECLRLLLESGKRALEPKPDVHDAWNAKVDDANLNRTWGMPQVASWYKNSKGRVTQNWPWRLVDFWSHTRAPNPDDFTFR